METPYNFVVQVNEIEYYCIICNCNIYGSSSAECHVQGKRHLAGESQFGCDILLIEENWQYYCTCCDRQISGFLNVHIHITGRKHLNRLHGTEEYEGEDCIFNENYTNFEEEELGENYIDFNDGEEMEEEIQHDEKCEMDDTEFDAEEGELEQILQELEEEENQENLKPVEVKLKDTAIEEQK